MCWQVTATTALAATAASAADPPRRSVATPAPLARWSTEQTIPSGAYRVCSTASLLHWERAVQFGYTWLVPVNAEEAALRFAHLLSLPEEEVPLDEAAILIGARSRQGLDVAGALRTLDDLAATCPTASLDDLVHHLFVAQGFRGNAEDYYSPANSYLADVLERRLGIPISLAVVLIEVGRRLGVGLSGVNMPGHFLVRTTALPLQLLDPFDAGRSVSLQAAESLYAQAAAGPFELAVLEPVGPRTILSRMLRNLAEIARRDRDVVGLAWALELRSAIPGTGLAERYEYAGALAAAGRYDDAAVVFEAIADLAEGDAADKLAAKASRMRARLN